MNRDDERHGTRAGYSAHRRAGQKPCAPCRHANSKITNQAVSYIDDGYDERDVLDGGRWMWDPRLAIRVWVSTGEVA